MHRKQNIIGLPEFADISLGHHTIQIRNHETGNLHVLNSVLWMLDEYSPETVLAELQKHHISLESFIEDAADTMQNKKMVLREIIRCRYDINEISYYDGIKFSAGPRGRLVADILETKIRRCISLGQVKDIFDSDNRFHCMMKRYVENEVKIWCRE